MQQPIRMKVVVPATLLAIMGLMWLRSFWVCDLLLLFDQHWGIGSEAGLFEVVLLADQQKGSLLISSTQGIVLGDSWGSDISRVWPGRFHLSFYPGCWMFYTVPYWLMMAPVVVTAGGLWAWDHWRIREHRRRRCCIDCGYPLAAGGAACVECGRQEGVPG